MIRFGCLLLISVVLSGCVAPQTKALRLQQQLPAIAELRDVPFFAQDEFQCGPAALATVLNYSGLKVTPDELVSKVYVPARKGSFTIEMVAAARQQGRLVYPVAENLTALMAAVDEGFPVLVLQNNGLKWYPVWHFAVVVGADQASDQIVLRSGETERLTMSFSSFERTWARSGYWAAIVIDPAELPDSLDPQEALKQLAILERVGAVEAAQAGFLKAIMHWPDLKGAWLGLANSSMVLGEKERAESIYRELIRRHPNYGPGLNNLADILLKKGQAAEALPYAERAVEFLDMPITRQTLQAVQAALAPEASAESVGAAPEAALETTPKTEPSTQKVDPVSNSSELSNS